MSGNSKTFQINYRDPKTGEDMETTVRFADDNVCTAEFWAENYAYALDDKGSYSIQEIQS